MPPIEATFLRFTANRTDCIPNCVKDETEISAWIAAMSFLWVQRAHQLTLRRTVVENFCALTGPHYGSILRMSDDEKRADKRDSLLLLAKLRVGSDEHDVKVRNLSAGGAMVEGAPDLSSGQHVSIYLRNIGWVSGEVAWADEDQSGIAFSEAIDPLQPRHSIASSNSTKADIPPPPKRLI